MKGAFAEARSICAFNAAKASNLPSFRSTIGSEGMSCLQVTRPETAWADGIDFYAQAVNTMWLAHSTLISRLIRSGGGSRFLPRQFHVDFENVNVDFWKMDSKIYAPPRREFFS
jgi:hypothetical protein